MTEGLTIAFYNSALDYVRLTSFPAVPAGMFMGLSSTDCGADGSGIQEITEGTYTRVDVASYFGTAAANGILTNDADIPFNASPGANWNGLQPIEHWFIASAVTGGAIIAVGEIRPAIVVGSTTNVSFPTGQVIMQIAQAA